MPGRSWVVPLLLHTLHLALDSERFWEGSSWMNQQRENLLDQLGRNYCFISEKA